MQHEYCKLQQRSTEELFWPSTVPVAVMPVLEAAVFAVVVLFLLFILRLYVVVKTGAKYKPGAKGAVSVLVVAGSGSVSLCF